MIINPGVGGGEECKVPSGGTAGQVLTKNSAEDGDAGWKAIPTPSGLLPTGGTADQVLAKNSATNNDVKWQTAAGRNMGGRTVQPAQGQSVGASSSAEIFNDFRERQFGSTGEATQGNVASGDYAHAEGQLTTASGSTSHAEGYGTTASGSWSHAEGVWTKATAQYSHAEGDSTKASGIKSHAEGCATEAPGECSHAEGYFTKASGRWSHAEGCATEATWECSHAEGNNTKATNNYAHAEGQLTTASGSASHAEGYGTIASGGWSHAEGVSTVANAPHSHAGGDGTKADGYVQTAIGCYNVVYTDASVSNINKFIVGKGTYEYARANCFRVTDTGVFATGAHNTTGADYAELFEWADGNQEKADRCGCFVTLDGAKIRLAGPGEDFILGIVSGNPSVVGDVHDDQWQGMYLYDVFGRPVYEDVEIPAKTMEWPDPENPEKTITEVIMPAHMAHRHKLNPDYDGSQKYQPRTQRPEWDAVGLLGKLVAVDDGTCQVNGWCTVGEGGVATASAERTRFRVMARLDECHVRVLIL